MTKYIYREKIQHKPIYTQWPNNPIYICPTPVPHLSHTCPTPVPHLSHTCPIPVPHLSHTCPTPVPQTTNNHNFMSKNHIIHNYFIHFRKSTDQRIGQKTTHIYHRNLVSAFWLFGFCFFGTCFSCRQLALHDFHFFKI